MRFSSKFTESRMPSDFSTIRRNSSTNESSKSFLDKSRSPVSPRQPMLKRPSSTSRQRSELWCRVSWVPGLHQRSCSRTTARNPSHSAASTSMKICSRMASGSAPFLWYRAASIYKMPESKNTLMPPLDWPWSSHWETGWLCWLPLPPAGRFEARVPWLSWLPRLVLGLRLPLPWLPLPWPPRLCAWPLVSLMALAIRSRVAMLEPAMKISGSEEICAKFVHPLVPMTWKISAGRSLFGTSSYPSTCGRFFDHFTGTDQEATQYADTCVHISSLFMIQEQFHRYPRVRCSSATWGETAERLRPCQAISRKHIKHYFLFIHTQPALYHQKCIANMAIDSAVSLRIYWAQWQQVAMIWT